MSANFALVIPNKILQIDKHFMKHWEQNFQEFKDFRLVSPEEFSDRPDVHLIIIPKIANRYHILDFGFLALETHQLKQILTKLFGLYPYGKIGLLKYWLDPKKRFPPIILHEETKDLTSLNSSQLPLDQVVWINLSLFNLTK